MKGKTVVTEQIAIKEENIQVRPRSPINILSEDEVYLLEEYESIAKTKARVGTCKEFSTLENKTVRPRKNKNRIEFMEFSIVKHQRRSLKMMGELASTRRSKTRPRNKLRLNMKKMLNPRLNTKEVTVLDDDSSDEKPLKAVKEPSLTDTKLSTAFMELRDELLIEQQ